MYMKTKGAIDRSRPGVDYETPWPGLSDEQRCEMDQAVAMLREAANQGHMEAQAYCGDLYDFGMGVAQDDRSALVYYVKAAQQGDAGCQHSAGVFYRDGRGCEQSYERAAQWFENGALREDADAMYELARLYFQGKGVPQNCERAVELFKGAALQGLMQAQCMLALCYEHGLGVAKDYLEARRHFTLSSAQGHAPSTAFLTRLGEKIRAECPLLGKRVMIAGTSREDLNGRVGVARSFDEAAGRYVVRLRGAGVGKSATQEMKVKPVNLKPAAKYR